MPIGDGDQFTASIGIEIYGDDLTGGESIDDTLAQPRKQIEGGSGGQRQTRGEIHQFAGSAMTGGRGQRR